MKTVVAGLVAALVMSAVSVSTAEVRTEVVEYRHGDAVLEGYMAYDDSVKGKRPGILVVHEWMGHNPYVRMRAEKLARLGYAAFALDMYGKGVRAKDSKEAASLAGIYKGNRTLMRARAQAGLDVLARHPMTDPSRLAAIGYCFGGTTVLELARSGAALRGVVSFHGGLDTPSAEDARNIRGKVLVLHGADDPYVKPTEIAAFQDEMRKAGVDWEFVAYGGAVHSFTNPDSGNDNSKGVAYNEKADRRSWEAMKTFLEEALK
ncbi:MAG: dienelactone hydrolase family protein [Deltaproteobacteria bacterium]|nr:dienelactone hydrolase family protein [Deltaproteobacteria bacterium]